MPAGKEHTVFVWEALTFETRSDLGVGVSVFAIPFPLFFEVQGTDNGVPNVSLLLFVPTFGNAFSALAIRNVLMRVQLAFDFKQDVVLRCDRRNYTSFRIVLFLLCFCSICHVEKYEDSLFSFQIRSDFNVVEVFWPESVPCDISCVSWAAEIHCGPPSCGHANTFKSILEPPTQKIVLARKTTKMLRRLPKRTLKLLQACYKRIACRRLLRLLVFALCIIASRAC